MELPNFDLILFTNRRPQTRAPNGTQISPPKKCRPSASKWAPDKGVVWGPIGSISICVGSIWTHFIGAPFWVHLGPRCYPLWGGYWQWHVWRSVMFTSQAGDNAYCILLSANQPLCSSLESWRSAQARSSSLKKGNKMVRWERRGLVEN